MNSCSKEDFSKCGLRSVSTIISLPEKTMDVSSPSEKNISLHKAKSLKLSKVVSPNSSILSVHTENSSNFSKSSSILPIEMQRNSPDCKDYKEIERKHNNDQKGPMLNIDFSNPRDLFALDRLSSYNSGRFFSSISSIYSDDMFEKSSENLIAGSAKKINKKLSINNFFSEMLTDDEFSPFCPCKVDRSAKIKKFAICAQDDDDLIKEISLEIEKAKECRKCNFNDLRLTSLPAGLLDTNLLSSLTELLLSSNILTMLPNEPFTNMKELVKLDLASNLLETIPVNILLLPKLEVLLCDNNKIKTIQFNEVPKGANILPKIIKIGLEWNDLQQFPSTFITSCPTLSELFLAENQALYSKSLPKNGELVKACRRKSLDGKINPLQLKMVNSPALVKLIETENWAENLPWINIEWNKIYPDKVLDFLYLGSLRTAQTIPVYEDLNINYVLTIGRDLEVVLAPGMKHLVLTVDDIPSQEILSVFDKAIEFINNAKKEKKSTNVLIHCFAGISRSVAVTAAYLMNTLYPMTRDQAIELIKRSRPAANPNEGFMKNLLEYEHKLKKMHKDKDGRKNKSKIMSK